MHQIATKM